MDISLFYTIAVHERIPPGLSIHDIVGDAVVYLLERQLPFTAECIARAVTNVSRAARKRSFERGSFWQREYREQQQEFREDLGLPTSVKLSDIK